MSNPPLAIASAVAVLSAAPVLAQSSRMSDRHLGFGVALSNTGDEKIPQFDIPIDVTAHVRVQPEFKFKRRHEIFKILVADTTVPPTDLVQSVMWFGTSLLYTRKSDRFGFYVGGTAGLARSATTGYTAIADISVPFDKVANDYFAGPLIGGEYFLHTRFSLGAAIGVMYQKLDFTSDVASQRTNLLRTRASFTARVYLR